jgi:enterochelin esterase-like enzyme
VQNAFDVPPTLVDRVWVSAVFAGIGIGVVAFVTGGALRRVGATGAILVFVLTGGLAINRDSGLFPTVGAAFGISTIPALTLPLYRGNSQPHPFDAALYQTWKPPEGMPSKGRYGSVNIRGRVSGFAARPAIVYLPPAALVKDPPALPVMIMMSGQGPGAAPSNVVDSGHIVVTLDRIAHKSRGLAPIVVIPDQLERPTNNPMCVDGNLGNSATYLTVDVPNWIQQHLLVETGPQAWAVGGFSQGGTCAIQLAASRPDLFGLFIDVSGQLGPRLQSTKATIEQGFGGNEAAFAAAQPLAIMKGIGRYSQTKGFMAVGRNDPRYRPTMSVLANAGERAGMSITRYLVPGSGHDWFSASQALQQGCAWLMPLVGLGKRQ